MIIQKDTIYKKTSTGKTQIWRGELDGNRYRTISGQKDGKQVTSNWTVCEGKNVGRSNETTPEQQAALELEALYRKKLEREYKKTEAEIGQLSYTKPMKSIKWYEDVKKRPKVNEKVALQPKLDGMRAIIDIHGIKSQDGKIIPGGKFVFAALKEFFEQNPNIKLDGELYNHDYKEDFEGLMSLLKKENTTPEEDIKIKNTVQMHLYDVPSMTTDYQPRYDMLVDIVSELDNSMFQLTYTEFHIVKGEFEETVEEFNTHCLESGYEGSMLRICSYPYENKKSNGLFKVKKFVDDEFPIVEILEGKGNWAGHAKAIRVKLPNGNICKAAVKGDMEYAKKLLEDKDKIVGKMATVTYLRYSKAGMLNLPIFKSIRWDV